MEVLNISILDIDELTNASMEPLKKSNKTSWICTIIMACCGLIMLALKDFVYGGIALCIALVFAICIIIFKRVLINKVKKANSSLTKGVYYEYIFKDNYVQIGTVTDETKSITQLNYADFYKIKDCGNLCFLFINPHNAYVLKKSGFSTPDEYKFIFDYLKSKISV